MSNLSDSVFLEGKGDFFFSLNLTCGTNCNTNKNSILKKSMHEKMVLPLIPPILARNNHGVFS